MATDFKNVDALKPFPSPFVYMNGKWQSDWDHTGIEARKGACASPIKTFH